MTGQRIVRPATAFSVASPTKMKRKVNPEPALFEAPIREWRTLKEFPDYEISNDGRLRRFTPGSNMKAGTLIRVSMTHGDYPKYGLTDPDGRRVHRNAHQLVAAEFLPSRPPGAIVLHDDDNRLNCVFTNMKWGTQADNIADAKRNGKWQVGADHSSARVPWARPRGEGHKSSKLTEDQVRSILVDSRTTAEIAREYGIDTALVPRIKNGVVWKHITNPEYSAMLLSSAHKPTYFRRKRPRCHDDSHLEFLRGLKCCICGASKPDAAHIRSANMLYGKPHTGMGEKPSDRWCVPVCRDHHDLQHSMNELKFWATHHLDPFGLALALYDASGDDEIADAIIQAHLNRRAALAEKDS